MSAWPRFPYARDARGMNDPVARTEPRRGASPPVSPESRVSRPRVMPHGSQAERARTILSNTMCRPGGWSDSASSSPCPAPSTPGPGRSACALSSTGLNRGEAAFPATGAVAGWRGSGQQSTPLTGEADRNRVRDGRGPLSGQAGVGMRPFRMGDTGSQSR